MIIKAANGEAVPVKAVGVPTICDKIAGQVVKKAVKKHPFLQTLRLADSGDNVDVHIELLLGADIYWKLVSGEVMRQI